MATVDNAGILQLRWFHMENTKQNSLENKAISPKQSTDRGGRAPTVESDKQQATSSKLQADHEATSDKPQASLKERQATSD